MKLYIVGSVGSGKTTLARRIAERTGIPCCCLDGVVYIPDRTEAWGNRKRPEEERNALFAEQLARADFILEDTGRARFLEGLRRADTVLLLEPPLRVRRKRILTRWVKQKLGLEKCLYRPHLKMLKAMFRWAKSYDTGADGTKARVALFREKTLMLRSNREVEAYLRTLPRPENGI